MVPVQDLQSPVKGILETYFAQQHHITAPISGQTPGHSIEKLCRMASGLKNMNLSQYRSSMQKRIEFLNHGNWLASSGAGGHSPRASRGARVPREPFRAATGKQRARFRREP